MLRGEPWIAVIGTAVLIMYKCLEFTHSEKKGQGLVFTFYLHL